MALQGSWLNPPRANFDLGPAVLLDVTISPAAALVGDTLSLDVNGTGSPAPDFQFRWYRDNELITGADGPTILATAEGLYKGWVRAQNALGFDEKFSTNEVIVRFNLERPSNTIAPFIVGGTTPGSILTVDVGQWFGLPAPTLTRQWYKDGFPIPGETGVQYVAATAGAYFCRVEASNSEGIEVLHTNTITVVAVEGDPVTYMEPDYVDPDYVD